MSMADDSLPPAGDNALGSARSDSAPSTELAAPAEISVLKQKVMTAVRSAITESMVERDGSRTLPPIDLDFSMPVAEPPPIAAVPAPSKPPLAEIGAAGLPVPTYPRLETGQRVAVSNAGRRGGGSVGLVIALLTAGSFGVAGAAVFAVPSWRDAALQAVNGTPEQPAPKPVRIAAVSPTPAPRTVLAPARPAAATAPKATAPTASSAAVTTTLTATPPPARLPANANATLPPPGLKDLKVALAAGRIAVARKGLLALADAPADPAIGAEVAFALARSFDSGYLATLPKADAPADRTQAERWYRRWHTLSVAAGTVSDSIVLDRLVRSLQ
jgi:hypothetical protein